MKVLVKKRLYPALLLFCGALTISCVTAPKRPILIPVTSPIQRIEFQGFSLLPPNGENWFLAFSLPEEFGGQRVPYIAVFLKKLPDEEDGRIIAATVTSEKIKQTFRTPEEYLNFIKNALGKSIEKIGYKLIKSRVSLDATPGPYCVRYDISYKVLGVPQFHTSAVILETRGLRCLHPDFPRVLIDISYKQQYRQEESPFALESEGDGFLKGLIFTSRRPLGIETIPVGENPQVIAVGHDDVWVAVMGENSVYRVDRKTYNIRATIPVGRGPMDLAVGDNAIWVINKTDGSLSRINPLDNKVVATISVGKDPRGVAAGNGAVWVSNSDNNTVLRINPRTNEVVATIKVGGKPRGIAVGKGAVWVAHLGTGFGYLSRIDPETNNIIAKIPTGMGSSSILVHGGIVWVLNQYDATVSRIDPENNIVMDEIPIGLCPGGVLSGQEGSPGVAARACVGLHSDSQCTKGISTDGKQVWGINPVDSSIWKIDPKSDKVVGRISLSESLCITVEGNDAWIITSGNNAVLHVDFSDQ